MVCDAEPVATVDSYREDLIQKANGDGVTIDELKQLAESETADRDSNATYIPLPDEVFDDAPGFLGDYYRFLIDHADKKLPESFLSAGLAVLATIAGRDFRFPYKQWNTRSNLYLFMLAPSGAGKDFARKVNERIIRSISDGSVQRMLGPNKFASDTAMLTSLHDYPKQLWQIDEFSKFLASINSRKAGPHVTNIAELLLELFSESDNPAYQAKAYAASKNQITLNCPHAVVYGTSTPTDFWTSLSAEQVQDGLMGRMLTFEDRYHAGNVKSTATEALDSDGCVIIDRSCLSDELPIELTSTLSNWLDQASTSKAATDIRILPDAYRRLSEHHRHIDQQRVNENSMRAAIWSRAGEKTSKLSMLAAMSRSSEIINIDDVNWAVRLVNALTRRMVRRIVGSVSENQQEANVKKVLAMIQEHGGMNRRMFTRKTQWLNQRDRNAILADLFTSGDLVSAMVIRKTNVGNWFGVNYQELLKAVVTTESVK